MKNILIIATILMSFNTFAFQNEKAYMAFANCEYSKDNYDGKIAITLLSDYLAAPDPIHSGLLYMKEVPILAPNGDLIKVDRAENIQVDYSVKDQVTVTFSEDNFLNLKNSKLVFEKNNDAKLVAEYATITCKLVYPFE